MLRTLVKYLLSLPNRYYEVWEEIKHGSNMFKKKKSKSPKPAHVSGRFIFPTDVFNLIQDFLLFFVRQRINGKLVIVSSP